MKHIYWANRKFGIFFRSIFIFGVYTIHMSLYYICCCYSVSFLCTHVSFMFTIFSFFLRLNLSRFRLLFFTPIFNFWCQLIYIFRVDLCCVIIIKTQFNWNRTLLLMQYTTNSIVYSVQKQQKNRSEK